jgi:hypothetical protein
VDGPLAGPELAVAHDRLFKELLTTFFVEFLDLFFPKLAALLDRDSIRFLPQEQFADLVDGDVYYADLLAEARFHGDEGYFLIHVEHQSTTPPAFPERFFRYFAAIYLRRKAPIYPIVIYSHDAPRKAQPSTYEIAFPDGRVLRFDYHVVQLNRLSWRKFVNQPNPVASALMAKMKVAERDRPRVKAECLRLMLTLKLDPARMKLITAFVDSYLRLNRTEEIRFKQSLAEADWPPEQKEAMMEIVTSWEQWGIEKGMALGLEQGRKEGKEEGRQEGRQEGRREAHCEMLWDLLASRFGPLDGALRQRLAAIDSVDALRALTRRALTAGTLEEVGI